MAASAIGAAATGRHGRRRRAVMAEINVTPFVDVMLVLLIVFMVTAPLITLSIRVDLPDTRGGTALNSDKAPLNVTVKKSGGGCSSQVDLFLDKTPMALGDLEAKFKAIKNGGNNGQQPPMCGSTPTRTFAIMRSRKSWEDFTTRALGRL